MKQLIFPSLMSKNQKELDSDLEKLKRVVKELHVDVVDGKFAPNLTFNFPFKLSKNFSYNVHLMVNNPEKWLQKFGKETKTIIFHPELLSKSKIKELIEKVKKSGKKVGLALKPETKVEKIKEYLSQLDYVLILAVHPGFYGSEYLLENLSKIKEIKKIAPKIKIIVDGGMNPERVGNAAKAGADYFVSGSYTTKAENPRAAIQNLMKSIKKK